MLNGMRLLSACIIFAALGCSQRLTPEPPPIQTGPETPGLHNVRRVTDRLISGGSPEGDEGFRSLSELSVKTIISVDGARPDLERAHRFGMRYVHLPIGYDGVPRDQILRIARAVRDLPSQVYLHCHHGKHRGPAAAAAARRCLDERCTVADALEFLRQAGTDPHYQGLFASVQQAGRVEPKELDAIPADFPESAVVAALVEAMVRIDERWDHLKAIRTAGWSAPPNHADLDPPHEALQLQEQF